MPEGHTRLRLLIAYHGGAFHGIAPQPGVVTVGGKLVDALATVLRLEHAPALVMSGRTDAGVHAFGQQCHVDVVAPSSLAAPGGLDRVHRSLRKLLGPSIVVRRLEVAPAGYDARFSALWRRYRYTILNQREPDPFLADTTWHVPEPLEIDLLRLGCDPFIGRHDFSSFCRAAEPGATNVRDVLSAHWSTARLSAEDPELLCFEIVGTAFCQQMVRSITGMMVAIGRGRRHAGEVAGVLRAVDRAQAAPIAPPHGLCLREVGYPDDLAWSGAELTSP